MHVYYSTTLITIELFVCNVVMDRRDHRENTVFVCSNANGSNKWDHLFLAILLHLIAFKNKNGNEFRINK